MQKIKNAWPYLLATALGFYLLPLLLRDTGSAILLLLVVIPLICFGCACLYGIQCAFSPYYALIVAALFLPTIFIFYNSSAWIYVVGYGVIALTGNLIGARLYRWTK